jgi:hypothetical protein
LEGSKMAQNHSGSSDNKEPHHKWLVTICCGHQISCVRSCSPWWQTPPTQCCHLVRQHLSCFSGEQTTPKLKKWCCALTPTGADHLPCQNQC